MEGLIPILFAVWVYYLVTMQGLSFLFYNEKLRKQMYDLFKSDFGKELPFHRYYEGKLWSVGLVNIMGLMLLIWGTMIPIAILFSISIKGNYLLIIPISANLVIFHISNDTILSVRSRFIKEGNIGKGGMKNWFMLLPAAHLSTVPDKILKAIYIVVVLMHFYAYLRIVI